MSKMATVTESKVNRPTRTEAVASNKAGAILEIDNLHVSFAGYPVLRDISLQIKRGQTLVVIGESGCGKTVLLKSIIRLIQPTEGAIRFEGRDLARMNDRELTTLRTRFGFVFQQAALFDSLTIGQNVAFPLRQHRKLSDEEVEQNVRQALMDVGLPDSVVFKRPAEISGGMRKRVGLARALVMNPELILYDEPTTGLDPIMSDVINELILRTQRRTQVTSIVITHDMNTARKVGDRIVMIYPLTRLREDEPQILFDGSADELERCVDRRVQQFVHGEAGERMMELERDNPLA
jgi:phospholipid/cholesterol/gamma-HCH transport system ATP-binding protein